jgi:hypothetical protein
MNIKLIHILNNLTGDREQKSIKSLSKLKDIGVNYIQQVTPLFSGDMSLIKPPVAKYLQPRNKAHYGLYQSYRKAIEENFTDDIDCLIVCECDSILNIDINYFPLEMERTLNFCNKYDLSLFSWGGIYTDNIIQSSIIKKDKNYPSYCITNRIIEAHFTIFPQKNRLFTLDKIKKTGWDSADIWLNFLMFSDIYKTGCSIPKFAYQTYGKSVLESRNKGISNKFNYKPSIFQISYNKDLNRVYVYCPIKKTLKVIIYTWDYHTDKIKFIYHKIKEFNNGTIWFQPNTPIMIDGGVKITIMDDNNNILEEKYMIYRDF